MESQSEGGQIAGNKGEESHPIAAWWPVIAATLLIGLVSAASMLFRITRPNPRDPWESIIVAEGYRASAGLTVYAEGSSDHSTHVYGPLITYFLGAIYKLTGVGFGAARLLSLAASLWVVAALTVIYFKRLATVFMWAGVVMLLSVDLRTRAYFTQSRPDMLAIGFGLLALILLYRGFEKEQWGWYTLGIVVLCAAYLFKQPAAMCAAIPLISVSLRRESWSLSRWTLAGLPMVAILVLIIVIRLAAPEVHYYMIDAVDRWPMVYLRLAVNTAKFVGFTALLPVALCVIVLVAKSFSIADAPMRWLAAACLVTVPTSILVYSKYGGELNSYLPALFPITVLSIVAIAQGWTAISQKSEFPLRRRHAFAWLFASVMIVAAFGGTNDELRTVFNRGLGDQHYPHVLEFVRRLHGRVVCPDDPTIPIAALHQAGRSSWAEHDMLLGIELPDYLAKEILGADFVVLVDSAWPIYQLPQHLHDWGYINIGWGGEDMGPYNLWRRRTRND